MNGSDSGLISGTSGSPQLSLENFEYDSKIKEIEEAINFPEITLTKPQISRLKTIRNTIKNHLKESDYRGTLADLEGHPIPNGNGGFFDHKKEMKDSYKALLKAQRGLKGSLNNPRLSQQDRDILSEALKEAETHLKRIEELFKPYGGLQ